MYLLFSALLLLLLPTILALPPAPLTRRCTNLLRNPSFETGLDPYLALLTGAFTSTRGIYTSSSGGHQGANFYYALSNSTVDATLTLSQSGIAIPAGTSDVECTAWVASRRPGNVGATRVEVFLDERSCGVGYLGTSGWTRIGGRVGVGEGTELGHNLAVVVVSDEAGEEGWSVWVDDLMLGVGC